MRTTWHPHEPEYQHNETDDLPFKFVELLEGFRGGEKIKLHLATEVSEGMKQFPFTVCMFATHILKRKKKSLFRTKEYVSPQAEYFSL